MNELNFQRLFYDLNEKQIPFLRKKFKKWILLYTPERGSGTNSYIIK